MKKIIYVLLALLAVGFSEVAAKVKDPVVMNIGKMKVPRSEFEAFYTKNSQLSTDTTLTFDNYVDMFVAYKLKVAEALSQGIDTTQSFKAEFETYRQQLIESLRDDNYWKDSLVRELLQRLPYEIKASHILLNVALDASDSLVEASLAKIEDFKKQIEAGAPFDSIARRESDCPSKARGGDLGFFRLAQMVYPFEDAAFSTPVGGMSICRSQYGYHLIKVTDRRKISLKNLNPMILDVINGKEPAPEFMGQLRMLVEHDEDRVKKGKAILDEKFPIEDILNSDEYKALYQEYYDGILLFSVANDQVWAKAESDTLGLQDCFKRKKENYRFEKPRFKGAFIECADDEALVKAMKEIYDNNDTKDAAELVRKTILKDTLLTPEPRRPRFHIVNGIFKPGDNAFVDEKLGIESEKKIRDRFPVTMVYGHVIEYPEALEDCRSQVVMDYQDELEKVFVDRLKTKFKVKINKKELEKLRLGNR